MQDLQSHAHILSYHTPLITKKPPPERKLVSFWKLKYIDIYKLKADVQQSSLVQTPVHGGVDDLVQQYVCYSNQGSE